MKKAAAFALVTLILLITAPAPAQEPENYCDDKQSWAEWADLVAKYPNDGEKRNMENFAIPMASI